MPLIIILFLVNHRVPPLGEDLLKESEQIESTVEHLPSKNEACWVEIDVEVLGFGKVSNWIWVSLVRISPWMTISWPLFSH